MTRASCWHLWLCKSSHCHQAGEEGTSIQLCSEERIQSFHSRFFTSPAALRLSESKNERVKWNCTCRGRSCLRLQGETKQGFGDRRGKHNWEHLAESGLEMRCHLTPPPPPTPKPPPCPAGATGLGMVYLPWKNHHHAESSKKRKVLFTGEHTDSRAAGNVTQG